LTALAGILLVLSAVASVRAERQLVLLTFDELKAADNIIRSIGPTYSNDGMTLTALSSAVANPDFNVAGTLSTSFAGTTMLFHHISGGEIQLTRADGGTFDFLAISLAELPAFDSNGHPVNFGPFDVTFLGTKENGSTVSKTVTVNPFPEIDTFKFHGFSNITVVTWHQGAGGGPGLSTHQFTNVTASFHAP
jgi:hypothetical protein